MATLQITVSRKGSSRPVVHETIEISRELAQELIAKMEAMIAELPGRHRTTRTIVTGTIICRKRHDMLPIPR